MAKTVIYAQLRIRFFFWHTICLVIENFMKKIIFILALVIMLPHAHAQTFASLPQTESKFASYSPTNFTAYRGDRPRPGALAIVGGCSMGVGLGAAFCGLIMVAFDYNSYSETVNETQHTEGDALMIGGGLMFAGGVGMLVGGIISDHKKYKGRWGVVTPKKNEVGFAYNF